MSKVEFKNGSSITPVDISGSSRGLRAAVFSWWSDELGCFIEYNENKPEGEQYTYFDLDENDEFIYFDIKKGD
jgi:hypothetical protein